MKHLNHLDRKIEEKNFGIGVALNVANGIVKQSGEPQAVGFVEEGRKLFGKAQHFSV